MPHQGGFSRSGQPHDAEDFALLDGETRVAHTQDTAVAVANFVLCQAFGKDSLHGFVGALAVDLPKVPAFDLRIAHDMFPLRKTGAVKTAP
ncbi:hypothetical protein [Roseibium sp.]|uniref:hypothetical protein n=1 Tax=Roseibium sp. TaxID=1936156 RepID=UPI003BA97B3B